MKEPRIPYVYHARLDRVIDGDTVDFLVDLGFFVHYATRIRLANVDAWEVYRGSPEERAKGRHARDELEALLQSADEIVLATIQDKKGKYGRFLADVFADGVNVNQWLVDHGHTKDSRSKRWVKKHSRRPG